MNAHPPRNYPCPASTIRSGCPPQGFFSQGWEFPLSKCSTLGTRGAQNQRPQPSSLPPLPKIPPCPAAPSRREAVKVSLKCREVCLHCAMGCPLPHIALSQDEGQQGERDICRVGELLEKALDTLIGAGGMKIWIYNKEYVWGKSRLTCRLCHVNG